MKIFAFLFFYLTWLATPLQARVLSVLIEQRDTILEGRNWGQAGAYELLKGKVFFGIDPLLRQNQVITDIGYAPVNENGLVLSSADLVVLKPVDPGKSNVALVEVSNRGGKFTPSYFLNGNSNQADAGNPDFFGDGLLLNRGVTIIWVGWQFDIPESEDLLNFVTPVAKYPEGSPIIGRVRSDWTVDETTNNLSLGHHAQIAYPVYDSTAELHVLTQRKGRDEPREIVDRNLWDFGRWENGSIVPDDRTIYSKNGFDAGMIYELVYYSAHPPLVGLGLAAIRDIIAYAKYDVECIFPVEYGIAAGVSQTGRFLRHFNYQGFNEDESGRRAYDGMMIITAGGGRGSFNHRFAQPSRDAHRYSAFYYPTDIFPFSGRRQTDPVTGINDGILSHLPVNLQPNIISVNTGYEYWGRSASLIHTDIGGKNDVLPQDNERIYHIASGQHFVDGFPPTRFQNGLYTGNPLEFRPNYRALLINLLDWVVDGKSPPESNFPQISKGELVSPSDVRYPDLPSFTPGRFPQVARRVDYGPEWPQGIINFQPPVVGEAFPSLVPQVDKLGNEISGIRNAEVAMPLATYIPYSLRQGLAGGNGEIADFRGTYIPLAIQGNAPGDGRITIREIYTGKVDYLTKVRTHLESLVENKFVLPEDMHRILERSRDYWNWLQPYPRQRTKQVSMMSYNIRFDNPDDGVSRWDARKSQVYEVIADQNPDFFGMQEALLHQCKDVEKALRSYRWIGVGREDGKNKGEFSPLFYQRKKWKLLESNTFWLSDTPDLPSKGWDAALPRIVTWGKFEEKKTGKIIYVFNTHFDHRGVEARIYSAGLIRQKIQEIAGTHSFLLSGDFNVNPSSQAYLTLTRPDEQLTVFDSKLLSLSNPQGPRGTFSGFKVRENLPRDQIDYIFCSQDFDVSGFEVIIKSRDGLYASDHFAVVARVYY
jgi:endonuclease/exonuclease/phosphatase family metal-dependent hydrolase